MFDTLSGCSRYLAGEGVVHTRVVDMSASIFQREGPSIAIRSAILRQDLRVVQKALRDLQHRAMVRQVSTTSDASSPVMRDKQDLQSSLTGIGLMNNSETEVGCSNSSSVMNPSSEIRSDLSNTVTVGLV
jgi:hypothetical protein